MRRHTRLTRAVPVERHGLRPPRGHAVPQARPHDELEPCRTVPAAGRFVCGETELPVLWTWRRALGSRLSTNLRLFHRGRRNRIERRWRYQILGQYLLGLSLNSWGSK